MALENISFIPLCTSNIQGAQKDAHVHCNLWSHIKAKLLQPIRCFFLLIILRNQILELNDTPPKTTPDKWMGHFRSFSSRRTLPAESKAVVSLDEQKTETGDKRFPLGQQRACKTYRLPRCSPKHLKC